MILDPNLTNSQGPFEFWEKNEKQRKLLFNA